ncbi:hypothetical protein [Pyruvatibacter mobilis]|uniref:hypothetical protein n=1 Tax=Pyruvatibacter mobilis TaxID=1712261 RepID=UPI003D13AB27
MMAKRIKLRIEVTEPISFSAQAVTTGGHHSLDHIPGAALLGVAAAHFYRDDGKPVDGVDAWTAFHSGKIRFGNGYPVLEDGKIALPVPRSLHARLGSTGVMNLSRAHRTDGAQYQQLRAGYIDASASRPGGVVRPHMLTTLKTAVDAITGTAASAQLFGTQSIAPGQIFEAFIECDDGLENQLDAIGMWLTGRQRIGKSRSAEYGRVEILLSGASYDAMADPGKKDECLVYCASDVWIGSVQNGQLPTAAEVGLASGELDLSRSFINYRRYAPYNGRWRTVAPERQVIESGSVLMFTGIDPDNRSTMVQAVVGAGREAGLGRVYYDPPCLKLEVHEDWKPLHGTAGKQPTGASEPKASALWKFMRAKASTAIVQADAIRIAAEIAEGLHANYGVARSLGCLGESELGGPGKTQWAQVSTVARETSDPHQLHRALFGKSRGLIPEDDAVWTLACAPDQTHRSALSAALEELLQRDGLPAAYVIELVARQMRDLLDRPEATPKVET